MLINPLDSSIKQSLNEAEQQTTSFDFIDHRSPWHQLEIETGPKVSRLGNVQEKAHRRSERWSECEYS